MSRRFPLALCLLAAACGGDGSTGSGDAVETVTITPGTFEIDVDETRQLTVTLRDAAGDELTDRTVTWSSGSLSIATVDENGVVTGVAEGAASIQAESEGKTGTSNATVAAGTEPTPPSGNSLNLLFFDKEGESRWGDLIGGLALEQQYYDILFDLKHPAKGTSVNGGGAGGLRLASARGGARRLIPTSSILYSGGYASPSSNNGTRVAVSIDAATYEVTQLEMAISRNYHTSTLLPGSRVLLVGGFDNAAVTNTAEVFDEATKTITTTGGMADARGRHAASALADGRVLVTGGLVPVGGGPVTIDVATSEIYDPVAGTFAPGPDMTATRFNHSAITLDDGRVLVLGGNGRNTAEVYDPVSDEFTAVDDMEVIHGLGHQAVKLLDGRVLVLGGGAVNPVQPTAAAEIFDPGTDQWTRIDDMTTPRMLHFAATRADGTVLIGGGQDDTGEPLASTEVFDPVAETFTATAALPVEATEAAAVFIEREE